MSEVTEEKSEKKVFSKKSIAIILITLGLIFLIVPFAFAIDVFLNYKGLVKPIGDTIAEALISVSYDLIDLVAKLAFLGVCVWIGAIVLKNGVELYKDKSEAK
ncbi:MAG: hypothetical protein QXJ17_06840 [Nitrososphaeria archaeon]